MVDVQHPHDPPQTSAFPLMIELVPKPCWYSNLRSAMPRASWDTLRREVYKEYGYQCAICKVSNVTLHCHERWQYDDVQHVQTLLGFICLCEWCHHVKHLGLAGIVAREGRLDFQRVVAHFLEVNHCDETTFHRCETAAWAQWEKRSKHQWRTDLGTYAHLVTLNKS